MIHGENGLPQPIEAEAGSGQEKQAIIVQEAPKLPEITADASRFPPSERASFEAALGQLPIVFQSRFLERFVDMTKDADEVRRVTGLRGITFEMTRIRAVLDQGLEQVDPEPRSLKVSYLGFKNSENDFSRPPSREVRDATIQIDVPIVRDSKLFAYEVKSYPRKAYGADAQARNQTLKYQAAIEKGVIAGAVVELRGRIDLQYLAWVMGETVDDPGAAPDVQFVYTFELPSGKEYRFTLKRGAEGHGLKFRNDERYEGADLDVVIGIQEAIADKSIIGIISRPTIASEQASEALRPYLAAPETINTLGVFLEYDRLRRETVTKELVGKRVIINERNEKSAVSEYAGRAYVDRMVREYQDYLAQNPAVAEVKRHYVLPDERLGEATEKILKTLEYIATEERTRAADSNEPARRAARIDEGYGGRPEGVTLDVEHVMLDTVYGMNKEGAPLPDFRKDLGSAADHFTEPLPGSPNKVRLIVRTEADLHARLAEDPELKRMWLGMPKRQQETLVRLAREASIIRTYDWPERFSPIDDFVARLNEEDRRYLEIHVFDPQDSKTSRQADTTEADITKTQLGISRENIARAETALAGTSREGMHKREITRLRANITALEKELEDILEPIKKTAAAEARAISRETESMSKRRQELLKKRATLEEIEALDAENVALSAQRTTVFAGVRTLSEQYQQRIAETTRQLEEAYRRIFPNREWESFAKRITKMVDQNILKGIYVVDANGQVIVQEEILRGLVTGRAAHSELAQGRNIYGAGEIVLTKGPDGWKLTEINNGSGHYRPDAEKTLAYVRTRIARVGVDVSRAKLVDSILRGRALRDASAF